MKIWKEQPADVFSFMHSGLDLWFASLFFNSWPEVTETGSSSLSSEILACLDK